MKLFERIFTRIFASAVLHYSRETYSLASSPPCGSSPTLGSHVRDIRRTPQRFPQDGASVDHRT